MTHLRSPSSHIRFLSPGRELGKTLLAGVALVLLTGCRILTATTAIAVGTVGLVGYGVYKTGEAAVTGVGSLVSSGAEGVESVVFYEGDFKTVSAGGVQEIWFAAVAVFRESGFQINNGDKDALSGYLNATLSNGEKIKLRLEDKEQGRTEFILRVGTKGDIKKSEFLHKRIMEELSRLRETLPGGRT